MFNRVHAEYEECRYDEDEPLSQADVYGINRDIQSHMYDIENLERGELTFRKLMRQYPIFLNDLRGIIERKWDILQRCKAQWGVDWAIQRVLQRDRIYTNKRSSRSVRSGGSRKSSPATSHLITRSSGPADSSTDSQEQSSRKHKEERFAAGEKNLEYSSDDIISSEDIGSENVQSGLEETYVKSDDGRNGNVGFASRRRNSKKKSQPKSSTLKKANATKAQSARERGSTRAQLNPGSAIYNLEVQKTALESSKRRTSLGPSSESKNPLRHGQRRKQRINASDSEEEEPLRRAPIGAPIAKKHKTVRSVQQKNRATLKGTRGARNK